METKRIHRKLGNMADNRRINRTVKNRVMYRVVDNRRITGSITIDNRRITGSITKVFVLYFRKTIGKKTRMHAR